MAALTDSEEGSDDSDSPSTSSQPSPRALQLARSGEGEERIGIAEGAGGVSSIMDDNVPFLMETVPQPRYMYSVNTCTLLSKTNKKLNQINTWYILWNH